MSRFCKEAQMKPMSSRGTADSPGCAGSGPSAPSPVARVANRQTLIGHRPGGLGDVWAQVAMDLSVSLCYCTIVQ